MQPLPLRLLSKPQTSRGCTVLWKIHLDPYNHCKHVNLIQKVSPYLGAGPGGAVPDDGEKEYLFVPYSAFTVLSASWNAGTLEDPHVIELLTAVDNKAKPEDLPLAPWS